jgi:hypothetical protein
MTDEEYVPTYVAGSASTFDSSGEYPDGFEHGGGCDWEDPWDGPTNASERRESSDRDHERPEDHTPHATESVSKTNRDHWAVAEIQHADFEDSEAFEEFCRRNGLQDEGEVVDIPDAARESEEIVEVPTTPFMWATNGGDPERGAVLTTGINPVTGKSYTHPIMQEDGSPLVTYEEAGSTSYVVLRGPVSAVAPIYDDLLDSTTYVKRFLQELTDTTTGEIVGDSFYEAGGEQ